MIRQATQTAKSTFLEHVSFMSVIKGIAVSYIVTIPTFILFAFILTFTDFPEKFISPAVIITTIISILVAGSTATRNVKNKGWLNGSVVGLAYMLVLYFLSSIVFWNFTISRQIITMLIIGVLTGSIGGIIGINYKRSRHIRERRANS